MNLKFFPGPTVSLSSAPPTRRRRCLAMTKRRTRCRFTATSTMWRTGMPEYGIHEVCELHWKHPPKEWWPKHG